MLNSNLSQYITRKSVFGLIQSCSLFWQGMSKWLPPSHGDSMPPTLLWLPFVETTVVTTHVFHLHMKAMHGIPPLWFPPSCGDSVVTMCVVTTRYCLDFGLNLTGNDTFCGNHGNHVVFTFKIMSCPPGNYMVSTWKPCGIHMETTWYLHRNHMVSTWKPCG